MIPRLFRVSSVREDTRDTATLVLVPEDGAELRFEPGQYTMLYVFGVGEVPISISGDPGRPEVLVHTIRAVGAVTRALTSAREGDPVGVRGPFGTPWPVGDRKQEDLLVVAGGIGLAPLRPVIREVLTHRDRFGRVAILIGARTPGELLYTEQIAQWRSVPDVHVDVTVDAATRGWSGNVGLITMLLDPLPVTATAASVFLCGPEVMIRVTSRNLVDAGTDPDRIFVSLERNMHCAIRQCGHCQLGPLFVCADGPVVTWTAAGPLLAVRRW
jgi:NAD(P)H-flavin reductase